MNGKRLNLIIGVLLGLSIIGTPLPKADAAQPSAAATRPDLDYLKAVHQAGPEFPAAPSSSVLKIHDRDL